MAGCQGCHLGEICAQPPQVCLTENKESRSNEDTILPGALDPKLCALCGAPVYSDLLQTSSQEMYGKILCLACEYDVRGGRL
jgi:hypothetical protein